MPICGHHPGQGAEAQTVDSSHDDLEQGKKKKGGGDTISEDKILHVVDMTPFLKSRIKVKVERVGQIKYVNKSTFTGTALECILADQSGQIKISAFSKEGGGEVKEMNSKLREGSVYWVSGATLRPVGNTKFNTTSHQYEIIWDKSIMIESPTEDTVMNLPYKLLTLSKVEESESGCILDVIGLVKEVGQCSTVESCSKTKTFVLRKVLLQDKSGTATLDLWDNKAEEFSVVPGQVLAVRRGQVQVFQGNKSLSITFTGSYEVQPTRVDGVLELVSWGKESHAASLPASVEGKPLPFEAGTSGSSPCPD